MTLTYETPGPVERDWSDAISPIEDIIADAREGRMVVLVDHEGATYAPDDVPMALRRAPSTRISVDGNAHFCRGLLRTRYPGSEDDQTGRPDDAFFGVESLFDRPAQEQ